MTKDEKQLIKLCQEKGVDLESLPNGHYKIKGPLTVNYYPCSKKQTAYVQGTTGGHQNVSPERALSMAFTAPKRKGNRKDKRAKGYHSIKNRLYRKSNKCCWCGEEFPKRNLTIEHVIPLTRGGLDNMSNMALACGPCNNERGSDMPELKVEM